MWFLPTNHTVYIVPLCDVFLSETNECDPNPCLNNGKCVDGVHNYTCICISILEDGVRYFYTGRNCAESEELGYLA